MSNEHKPHIMARTEEEFKELIEKVNKLPPAIFEKIERASNGLGGVECHYKKEWGKGIEIILPDSCKYITQYDDSICCFCGDYYFKIPLPETYYNYKFIEFKKDQQ